MISGKPSSAQMSNEIESFEFYYKLASLYIKTFEEIQIQKLTCYKQNCHEKVLFECKCLAHATFICQTHIGTHLIEGISQRHVPIVLNPEIYDQKWDKVVNYLHDHNYDLKNLKSRMVLKVKEYVAKINKDVCHLFTNIDVAISKNNQKILDLTNNNLKMFEKMSQKHSDFLREFTKKCEKIEISDGCLDITQAEISDWNPTIAKDVIAKIPTTAHNLGSKLFHANDWNKSLEIISSIERLSNDIKPKLHWCEWESNEVHYFDWYDNTHKSMTIKDLNILQWSKSIPVDHNNILLCGGAPDDIEETNENMSNLYKINFEKKSFQTLASMNTGRANHSMTHLNGFFYALGGLNYQNHAIKKCERYSLENDSWEEIADLNHERDSATCVSIIKENCIYMIGGKDTNYQLAETIEKYDVALNEWNLTYIQKPILRQVLGCCLLPNSNIILIYGGENVLEENQKECYFYNYKTNQVTYANSMTSDFNSVLNKPVILDNKIYSYFWVSMSEREVSVYDIESGVWSIKP